MRRTPLEEPATDSGVCVMGSHDHKKHRSAALRELAAAAKAFPQLRICQLIGNATNKPDTFYVTDEELARWLREYVKEHGAV
jgi:hypothetical protein